MKKKVLMCTLLAGSLLLGAAVPVMAAEITSEESAMQETEIADGESDEDNMTDINESTPEEVPVQEAVAGQFSMTGEKLAAYDKLFRISAEHILSVTNNGGKYGSSVLANLTDGDTKTHWETGKANNDNFKNEVIFTFDNPTTLGSIVYYPRVNGAANKGYPTSYSIYASDGEGNFRLVTEGSYAKASGAMQITFTPAEFKQLKFVFKTAKQNWAAGAEMVFYAPDMLPSQVADLFTDGTMSALKPEYQDLSVLEDLLAKAKEYPDETLLNKVQMALDIQQGTKDYAAEIFEVEQRGNMADYSRKVLNTGGYSSNILPTGLTAKPGETIKIYVDVDDGAPLPSVVFTQQIGKFSEWERSFQLREGENILTTPKIYKEVWAKTKVVPGGAIYLANPYTPEEQGSAPRVRIEGGETYPLFRDGDNVEQFLAQLQAYQTQLTEHPDSTIDIVELYSDWFILNGNMKAARKYLSGEKNPQDIVTFHNERQKELLRFAGIDDRGPLHERNNVRANIRLMQPFAFAYAAGGHVGFQQGSINTFFNGGTGWAYSHEIGHQLDTRGGFIAETTNNMWANHIAVEVQGEYDRVKYGPIFQNQASDNYAELVKKTNNLGMWWQLHLLDENYWPAYQSAYREGLLADSGLTKNERMAVISCYALGMDVIEHFERYKFVERNDAIDAALAELNIEKAPENIKPWYLWTKAALDRNSVFTQDYQPEITSAERNGDTLTLTIGMDSSADAALLGYEVMEDGKVLGFTSGNTFTGAYTDDGREHTYTVRAYDLRMNQSQISQPYTKNLRSPEFQITGGTLAALYGSFDPLSIVEAKSYDGQDITGNIQVIDNSVNTEERGLYTVTYSVEDTDGNASALTVDIQVVSRFDYLSDLEETSAAVGYGKLKKDTSIKGGAITLLRNGKSVTYDKGLGAHASSSIVYDVADKGYRYFEAFAGIDQAVAGNKASNAIFRVLADGQVIYESQEMKADTDAQYIKLDISGVSQIELVTDSNGANKNDHTVWADAKFATESSVPVISASDEVYLESDAVDIDTIVSKVTVSDTEDGDLTGALSYETDFVPGGTGLFDITYTAADSDGNIATLTKKIVVVNDFVYTSDVDYKSAKVGWGKLQKDKSLNGKTIKLRSEDGLTDYEKGLGVHAPSEVVYDLTDKDYYYFTSFAGVDQTAGNNISSVVFRVYTDGVLAAETPVMKKDTPAQFLCVDISNAKQLKLVVTDAGNGNGNDHANWADAKFLTAVKTAPPVDLAAAEKVLDFARKADSLDYVDPSLNHREERLENLKYYLDYAEEDLNRSDLTQEDADKTVSYMIYFIEEIGQVYSPDSEPVNFAAETISEDEIIPKDKSTTEEIPEDIPVVSEDL